MKLRETELFSIITNGNYSVLRPNLTFATKIGSSLSSWPRSMNSSRANWNTHSRRNELKYSAGKRRAECSTQKTVTWQLRSRAKETSLNNCRLR